MENEYRALMNYVQVEFITSYKKVNSTIKILAMKIREIFSNITKMKQLYVKCPDIILSNILGLDLNKKIESLGIMSNSIVEEYTEIVNLAEKENTRLCLESETICNNITTILKSYNGLNFFHIAEQLQNIVDTNKKNTQILEKYISDFETCDQQIKQNINEVELIITIPLTIKKSLDNTETEVLTQYSKLVDLQTQEAAHSI